MLGNIDPPAICKECGVTTTIDSVQQICWECWIQLEDEDLKENAPFEYTELDKGEEE